MALSKLLGPDWGGTTVSPFNTNIDVGSASDRLLLVNVQNEGGLVATPTSVTYDGVAMAVVMTATGNSTYGMKESDLPTGSNQLSVTWAANPAAEGAVITFVVLAGVHQGAAVADSLRSSTLSLGVPNNNSISLAVTTVADDYVISMAGDWQNTGHTATGDNVERFDDAFAITNKIVGMAGDFFANDASATMGWDGCQFGGQAIIVVIPAASPAIDGDVSIRVAAGAGMSEGRQALGSVAFHVLPAAAMLEGRQLLGDVPVALDVAGAIFEGRAYAGGVPLQVAIAAAMSAGAGNAILGSVPIQLAFAADLLEGRQITGSVPHRMDVAGAMLEGRQLLGDISFHLAVAAALQSGLVPPFADLVIAIRAATALTVSDQAATDLRVSSRPETRLVVGVKRCA